MSEPLYTPHEIKKTYEKVNDLLVTKHIIKTYSTNRRDVRDAALKRLDLRGYENVLDLGCGYGFFIEKLDGMLGPRAKITGIDLVGGYEGPYLDAVRSIHCGGNFIRGSVDEIRNMGDSSFGLIVSSYSLYFFPHIIAEIARVLKNDGIFISVTHSESSLGEAIEFTRDCMKKMGLDPPEKTALKRLFMAFSLENGSGLLSPHFESVEKIPYRNSMVFGIDHIDDCIYYLEKKRNLIYKEVIERHPGMVVDLEACIAMKVFEFAKRHGRISFNKDDGIFICRKQKPGTAH
jgi:ubiquinone/menaquinone biosynthesis C-methylase UbiE